VLRQSTVILKSSEKEARDHVKPIFLFCFVSGAKSGATMRGEEALVQVGLLTRLSFEAQ